MGFWDYHVPVAYAIGYTQDERRKLADTAMATFRRIFGRDVKSIASWNLDAMTVAHLSDSYHVDAFGNCRDQLATDGFTIWGAPMLFEWTDGLSTLVDVTPDQLKYKFDGFNYAVQVMNGVAAEAADGVKIVARENPLRLMMAQ